MKFVDHILLDCSKAWNNNVKISWKHRIWMSQSWEDNTNISDLNWQLESRSWNHSYITSISWSSL